MNIAFFLLPKDDVVYLTPESTMRQALERMEFHRYTAVPLIDSKGKYVGTLTEGDLLWAIKNSSNWTFEDANKIQLKSLPLRVKNKAVSIDANMEDLISLAIEQNFVPVIDDNKVFVGIIRRREIIEYCYKKFLDQSNLSVE